MQDAARPLQGAKPFTHAGQQQAGRFGQQQVASATLEQPAGEVFFQGTDVPADGALGDRQFLGSPGERTVPGGGFEGPQGVERG